MDRAGDQVLAGAAFALNQNGRGFAGGDLVHEGHQVLHALRFAHHVVIGGAAALQHFLPQRLVFRAQLGGLQGVLHRHAQFVVVDRFADKVVCALLQGQLHIFQLGVRGDHNDRAGIAGLLQPLQDLQPVHVLQAHVQQHQVGRLVLGHAQPIGSALGLGDLISPFLTFLAQGPAHQLFVIDDQDFFTRHNLVWPLNIALGKV